MTARRLFQATGWLCVAAIVALSLVAPSLRPVTFLPHNLEHLAIFIITGLALSLGYPGRLARHMLMLVIFGSLSGILAAAGVYGLTAYVVGQRTRELGIRLALGASPTDLVRRLLGDGLRLCLIGTILGLGGALVLSRFLRSLVFGVSVADGPTIVAIVMTMTIVVLTATYLPASRASKIDPVLTLRQD